MYLRIDVLHMMILLWLWLIGVAQAQTCGPGTYIDSDTCHDCPSGFQQPYSNQIACFECVAGRFSASNATTECDNCPIGFFASSPGSSSCTACAPNLVQSMVGQAECFPCVEGYYRLSSSVCAACGVGKYNPDKGATSCEPCPENHVQPNTGKSYCIACGYDEIASVDNTECSPCSSDPPCCDGFGLTNGTCVECPLGTFEQNHTCVTCPAGFVSKPPQSDVLTGAMECEACPAGHISQDAMCAPCPIGTFQSANQCQNCSDGLYQDNTGQTSCKTCPVGYVSEQTSCAFCLAGEQLNGTVCEPCPANLTSAVASVNCSAECPAFSVRNGSTCEYCPSGMQSNDENITSLDDCEACSLGTFKADAFQNDCQTCPSGFISNDDFTACETCPGGKELVGTNCENCTVGKASQDSACLQCTPGTFQDDVGQTTCHNCPAGFESSGGASCTACSETTVAQEEGTASCEECPFGMGRINATYCEICPTGKETFGGICDDCPAGKQTSDSGCVTCSYGRASLTKDSTCELCAAGRYYVSSSECGECNASNSEYPNVVGQGSTYCIICETNTACQSCEAGKYNDDGACYNCPDGYVNPTVGSACTECESPDIAVDRLTCERCPSGFTRLDGMSCTGCAAGRFGVAGICDDCARGQYQHQTGQTSCLACPTMTTTALAGASDQTQCETCASEFTVVLDGLCATCTAGRIPASTLDTCEDCPSGRFRYAGQLFCQECPPGQFADHTDGLQPCQTCPAGTYNDQYGQSQCTQCSIQNSEYGSCNQCIAGRYKKQEGASVTCNECPTGFASVAAQDECQACAKGTYQSQTAQETCTSCMSGLYQNELGQSGCKACPVGFFQPDDGQGACHDCLIGTFEDTQASTECQDCPSGTYTVASASTSVTDCIACPAGYFELGGTCSACAESSWQDETGQTDCKPCPEGQTGPTASTSEDACFSVEGIVSYVFGNKKDSKEVQTYEKECEIRPNLKILCPGCSCNDDSRNGFWSGPICDECRRGYATRTCTVGCAGYNGEDDETICSGKGKCWFGKFGNGLCYCGGRSVLDPTAENAVVDVRTCPKGKICPGYGVTEQADTNYRPLYYIILYRQYSAFVLQLNKYTPARGHMWFKRFAPSKAYENTCLDCVGEYTQDSFTRIGYWSNEANNNDYTYFTDALQTKNGFHGENCQYECGLCLNGGRCSNVAHKERYSYTLLNDFQDYRKVHLPVTTCICSSLVFDAEQMCCPNGFQPYIFYGKRDTTPYTRFTRAPYITSLVNKQYPYWINKDILLETDAQYRTPYYQPEDGEFYVANNNRIYSDDAASFVKVSFSEFGPYDKHPYFGVPKEICRACPGLFGKGVRSATYSIDTELKAEDFWWDNSMGAAARKCNGVGVCNFYEKNREEDVNFMGNAQNYQMIHRGKICASGGTTHPDVVTKKECASVDTQAAYFSFTEPYFGGSDDMIYKEDGNVKFFNKRSAAIIAALIDFQTAAFVNYTENNQQYWVIIAPGQALPRPDSDSKYFVHPVNGVCRTYPSCDETTDQFGYNVYTTTLGHGADRLPDSTFNRFDTCFTFTLDNQISVFGLYSTIDYKQGMDPFLGGLCPKGHFCTNYDNVGYKEACPPGYYQPLQGITRTKASVQCSVRTSPDESACNALESTRRTTDFVDKVCIRCPRNQYSDSGSFECTECPNGRVKKISGVFDLSTNMYNFPTAISEQRVWYYHENELGDMELDCALIPESLVHVPSMNSYMRYDLPDFLPVLSCPFGYSSRPGTIMYSSDAYDLVTSLMISKIPMIPGESLNASIYPPYIKFTRTHSYVFSNDGEFCSKMNIYGDLQDELEKYTSLQSKQECRIAGIENNINILKEVPNSKGPPGCYQVRITKDGADVRIGEDALYWNPANLASSEDNTHVLQNVRYMCKKGINNDKLIQSFTRQNCIQCPNNAITGPESGLCTSCFANRLKFFEKEAIQKMVSGSTMELKVTAGPVSALLYEADSLWNIGLVDTSYTPSTHVELTTLSSIIKVSESDCYLACMSVLSDSLQYIGMSSDKTKCRCSSANNQQNNVPWANGFLWKKKSDEDVTYNSPIESWVGTSTSRISLPLCSTCPPGRRTDENVCDPCTTGQYTSTAIEASSSTCQECSPGYYQNLPGQTGCKVCPEGYSGPSGASEQCEPCKAGKSQPNTASLKCENCPQGYASEQVGLSTCSACASGKYQSQLGQNACLDCPAGKYTITMANTGCKSCAAGQFKLFASTSECSDCPTGRFMASTGSSNECNECQAGQYSDDTGLAKCKDCPDGWYQSSKGQLSCTECPGGTKCSQTSIGDTCPAGKYIEAGQYASSCKSCDDEHEPTPAGTGCQWCPDGTSTFGSRYSTCQQCPSTAGTNAWSGQKYPDASETLQKCDPSVPESTCSQVTDFPPGDGSGIKRSEFFWMNQGPNNPTTLTVDNSLGKGMVIGFQRCGSYNYCYTYPSDPSNPTNCEYYPAPEYGLPPFCQTPGTRQDGIATSLNVDQSSMFGYIMFNTYVTITETGWHYMSLAPYQRWATTSTPTDYKEIHNSHMVYVTIQSKSGTDSSDTFQFGTDIILYAGQFGYIMFYYPKGTILRISYQILAKPFMGVDPFPRGGFIMGKLYRDPPWPFSDHVTSTANGGQIVSKSSTTSVEYADVKCGEARTYAAGKGYTTSFLQSSCGGIARIDADVQLATLCNDLKNNADFGHEEYCGCLDWFDGNTCNIQQSDPDAALKLWWKLMYDEWGFGTAPTWTAGLRNDKWDGDGYENLYLKPNSAYVDWTWHSESPVTSYCALPDYYKQQV